MPVTRSSNRNAETRQVKKKYQDDNSDSEDDKDERGGTINGRGNARGRGKARGRGRGRGRGRKTKEKGNDAVQGEEHGKDAVGSDVTNSDNDKSSDSAVHDI